MITIYTTLLTNPAPSSSTGICAAKLADSPREGDMMVTSASAEQLQSEYLPALTSGQAWIGGTMPTAGPGHHTTMVSGDVAALDELLQRLQREGIRCRRLGQRLAWHSPQFEPFKDEYLRQVGDGPLEGPEPTARGETQDRSCRQFSSLTGRFVPPSTLRTPAYWGESLVSSVNFHDSFAGLMQYMSGDLGSQHHVFLEIGPHPVFRQIILSAFEKKTHGAANADMAVTDSNQASKGQSAAQGQKPYKTNISYNSMLQTGCDDVQSALEAVGRLWCHGCRVDLDRMNFPSTT